MAQHMVVMKEELVLQMLLLVRQLLWVTGFVMVVKICDSSHQQLQGDV
ncbi:hypothetical protein C5167_039417 [Papaver somniferum]|uniref:Uncharacterized protein n=1 Tax=Papaver somniferum TaxID=3469 RepID=A0A4Y7IEJ2_PAPSO|nr:hypothetical protein C5167_039417 [Papaver somniferum]